MKCNFTAIIYHCLWILRTCCCWLCNCCVICNKMYIVLQCTTVTLVLSNISRIRITLRILLGSRLSFINVHHVHCHWTFFLTYGCDKNLSQQLELYSLLSFFIFCLFPKFPRPCVVNVLYNYVYTRTLTLGVTVFTCILSQLQRKTKPKHQRLKMKTNYHKSLFD